MYKKISKLIIGSALVLAMAACVDSESANEEVKTNDDSSQKEPKKEEAVKEESEQTVADWLKMVLPQITYEDLELADDSYNYVTDNKEIFPADSEEEISEVKNSTDTSIDSRHLNKNVSPYYEKVLTATGTVIDVEEEEFDVIGTASIFHVFDDDMNSYMIILPKSSGDILEDDEIRFWGSPLGKFSFENLMGGHTNAQMFIGSHVEKIQ